MTTDTRIPTVADVIRVIESMYDPAWARDWDAVGLVCGDPNASVRRVLLAVDPVDAVVEEALAWHADLVFTHHPLLLRPVHGVGATNAKGRIVHRLIRAGSGLYVAHTNADVAVRGVSDALARVLGLTDLEPLSADEPDPVDKIVSYVPSSHVDKVVDAMVAAGAGELGECSRVPLSGDADLTRLDAGGAGPLDPGRQATTDRWRIELLAPRVLRSRVLGALRTAHPSAEPPLAVQEVAGWSSPRGIGRIGRLSTPTTLREFALLVAEALPATAQGVRVAGEPTAEVVRVAVCGGSGDTLMPAVRACGADVFVTADLRHHPASESREEDAGGPPYLVDVAHWASEWPWLAGVGNRLEGELERLGAPIEVHVSNRSTDPWAFRVPSPGGVVR